MNTPIRQTLDRLLALQKIDSDLEALKRTKSRLDTGAGHESKLSDARRAADASQQELSRLSGELKAAELEQASIELKLKSYEDKMRSGKLTSAREISNFEKEIGQLGRQRSTLDDKLLQLMEGVEAARTKLHADEAESREREQELATQKAALHGELSRIESQVAMLEDGRRSAVAEITDAEMLARYNALRSRPANSGIAVARIVDRHCGGCHMQVSSNDEDTVRLGEKFAYCDNCGRLLG
jgi:predicted  nucleic acid-binding Zn-ribbon protein